MRSDRVPEELWTEVCNTVQEAVIKTIIKKKKRKKAKWLSEETLKIAEKRRERKKVKSLSRVQLFETMWTVAYQASQSMKFSGLEYWSGLPFPSPGDLPDPGIEPSSPTLQAGALLSEPPGKPREAKGKGENERYTHLNAEFQRIARRDKKAFLSDQCKEIEENNRMGKTRDLFKKIRNTKGTLHSKMAQ